MKKYLQMVRQVTSRFLKVNVVQMARGQNQHANSLAMLVSSMTEEVSRIIKVELMMEPSINITVGVLVVAMSEPCWMDPIINFLVENRVPDDEKEADRVCWVAARYWLSANCKLYWRSFGRPYLLCLCPKKVNELLTELHEGVCSSHI